MKRATTANTVRVRVRVRVRAISAKDKCAWASSANTVRGEGWDNGQVQLRIRVRRVRDRGTVICRHTLCSKTIHRSILYVTSFGRSGHGRNNGLFQIVVCPWRLQTLTCASNAPTNPYFIHNIHTVRGSHTHSQLCSPVT